MKKWLIGGGIAGALAVALLVGGLVTGVFAQGTTPPAKSEPAITPEQAEAAALAANPGTTVVGVDLDREGGVQVYEVKLDNGLEVQVDASDGTVLGSEQDDDNGADDSDDVQEEVESQVEDTDEEAGDVDDVQEEVEDHVDDALEGAPVEDAPGQ